MPHAAVAFLTPLNATSLNINNAKKAIILYSDAVDFMP
jgi:hypothetical protein